MSSTSEAHPQNCECMTCTQHAQSLDRDSTPTPPPAKKLRSANKKKITIKPILELFLTYVSTGMITLTDLPKILKSITINILQHHPLSVQTMWELTMDIIRRHISKDGQDTIDHSLLASEDTSFTTSGSQDDLTILTTVVRSSLSSFLTSSDPQGSSTVGRTSQKRSTSTSYTIAPTPTDHVDARSLQTYAAGSIAGDDDTDGGSSDEELKNVSSRTSKIYNFIRKYGEGTGLQHRSVATPGKKLVQLRIMDAAAARKVETTKRWTTTTRFVEVTLNPIQHNPQLRMLNVFVKDCETIVKDGKDLDTTTLKPFTSGWRNTS